jgi:hypothetical protein
MNDSYFDRQLEVLRDWEKNFLDRPARAAARASDLNGEYWPVVATATLLGFRTTAPMPVASALPPDSRRLCAPRKWTAPGQYRS